MSDQALRVVVVDDEEPARSRLKDLIGDIAGEVAVELAGEAADGRSALDLLASTHADVVLLDVRMPEMDGIEVAEHLAKLDDPPAVIFTTAYDAYAVKAFDLHAIDYLLKPIRATRLAEALGRARTMRPPRVEALREARENARANFSVQERGRIYLVPVEEVIYLKAEMKYVTVRTKQREYLLEESLTRLEEEFGDRFLRVHRNCLVARAAIAGFERVTSAESDGHWVVLLKDLDEKLDVSRRQQHIVREFGR